MINDFFFVSRYLKNGGGCLIKASNEDLQQLQEIYLSWREPFASLEACLMKIKIESLGHMDLSNVFKIP